MKTRENLDSQKCALKPCIKIIMFLKNFPCAEKVRRAGEKLIRKIETVPADATLNLRPEPAPSSCP